MPKKYWSEERTLRFLDLYEKEPIIWTNPHPTRESKREVNKAWKRIQNGLGMAYTIGELRQKKSFLITGYWQCKKNMKKALKRKCGTSKPKWFAYEKMSSIWEKRDAIMNTKSNIQSPKNTKTTQNQIITTKKNISIDIADDSEDETDKDLPIDSREMPILERMTNEMNDEKGSFTRRKRKQSVHQIGIQISKATEIVNHKDYFQRDEEYVKSEETLFKTIKQKTKPNNDKKESCMTKTKEITSKDECDLYGELITSKIQRLNDEIRDYAMNEIDNFMYKLNVMQNTNCDRPSLQV